MEQFYGAIIRYHLMAPFYGMCVPGFMCQQARRRKVKVKSCHCSEQYSVYKQCSSTWQCRRPCDRVRQKSQDQLRRLTAAPPVMTGWLVWLCATHRYPSPVLQQQNAMTRKQPESENFQSLTDTSPVGVRVVGLSTAKHTCNSN